MSFPSAVLETQLEHLLSNKSHYDAVIFFSSHGAHVKNPQLKDSILQNLCQQTHEVDARLGQEVLMMYHSEIAGGRLIHAPVGLLNKDYDDVRCFADAASKAMTVAKKSGVISPLFVFDDIPQSVAYERAIEAAYLGACQALWQPLEAREALNEQEIEPMEKVGLYVGDKVFNVNLLQAIESGRRLARDLCGTEPERMAPPKFADYCVEAFKHSDVQVSVIDDTKTIEQDYPLLAAVARASCSVERHKARVIHLEYTGKGPIKKTLFFVGKAVTYDTGGADVKTGGHMAGMSRDKGGGSAVAGFMKVLAELKPEGIKVVASIGAVRNSIGANAFVADEIIQSHAGKRVRIGNTDAEGRLVMVDLLSHFREQALDAESPELFTVATLTGHAALTVGPYTLLVENGPALDNQLGQTLAAAGEQWGDCAETSRSRREDWALIQARSQADDVLSSNNGPSVTCKRGHQFPMAFLSLASGLDEHGRHSEKALPYVHIDIAGSAVEGSDWQHGKPTAAPIVMLAAKYLI